MISGWIIVTHITEVLAIIGFFQVCKWVWKGSKKFNHWRDARAARR